MDPVVPPTQNPQIQPPPLPSAAGERLRWGRAYGAALPYLLATHHGAFDGPVLLLTEDQRAAERMVVSLRFLLGDQLPVRLFPDWETLPYDRFSPHQDIVSQRLQVLYELPELERGIVVAAVSTAMLRLPPPDFVREGSLVLQVGDTLDLEDVRERMSAAAPCLDSDSWTRGNNCNPHAQKGARARRSEQARRGVGGENPCRLSEP